MTNSEKKGNKLLAIFMGNNPLEDGRHRFSRLAIHSDKSVSNKVEYFTPSEMKYHKSWDWIIGVVKKIREVINTELSIDEFDLKRGYAQRLNAYDYDKRSIFKGCVEFVKWYNHREVCNED